MREKNHGNFSVIQDTINKVKRWTIMEREKIAKYNRSLYLKYRDNSKEKDNPVENNIKLL